jgi:hypothetical protein
MLTDIFQFMLWSFWFFIWISAVMIWFQCIVDLFRDNTLSGMGKAGWALVLILLPWVGGLIYLIARGKSMSERQMAAAADVRAAQKAYIQQAAGTATNPAEQIASAKALLDSGAVTQAEYDALKAKALA